MMSRTGELTVTVIPLLSQRQRHSLCFLRYPNAKRRIFHVWQTKVVPLSQSEFPRRRR
jgi:hypothetical protein